MEQRPDTARQALRQRLGAGARFDAEAAPVRDLAWARLGTAYFARKLNELSDADLDGASLLPGWTRRHVIALVAYEARSLALQVEAARTGEPFVSVPDGQRAREVELGATLPSRALRNLFNHTEVHLNVEWRDLTDAGWERSVDLGGTLLPVRQTAWRRARAIWVHAVDLGNGGSFLDMPPALLDALLAELAARWGRLDPAAAVVLEPADRPRPVVIGPGAGPSVRGATADLVRWMAGRGARRLASSAGALPDLPDACLSVFPDHPMSAEYSAR